MTWEENLPFIHDLGPVIDPAREMSFTNTAGPRYYSKPLIVTTCMPNYQRTSSLLGLIGALAVATPALSAPGTPPRSKTVRPRTAPPPKAAPRKVAPRPKRAPRQRPMSGPKDRPIPGDSRYPSEQPRPTGALLAPLSKSTLKLLSEHLIIRCRFRGGGCSLRHEYVIRNTGATFTGELPFVSPVFGVEAELDGKRVRVTDVRDKPEERLWKSTGKGVSPGSAKKYAFGGPARTRRLRHQQVQVTLKAGGTHTIAILTNSVGGFDRFHRGRTQPEVAFALTRRKDNFVYHHELRLRDPAARATPGGAAGAVTVELHHPPGLDVGSSAKLKCETVKQPRTHRRCRGRLTGTGDLFRWSLAQKYKRPVGLFLSAGVAFNNRGTEALLRAGLSLMVRRRKDLVTLTAETDVKERVALALVYQFFLPYTASSMEMGLHFEGGLVLDVTPGVRPALRLGAVFHFAFARVNLLFDLYPTEFKAGGAPSWRGIAGAGIGF